MNNIAKILLGVGVVGAVAATAYVVTKKSDDKEVNSDIPVDNGEEVVEEKATPKDFVAMIKDGASKKATQILAWVILHKDQIEAVGTALGIFAGILGVVNAIKEYAFGKKLHSTLQNIADFQDEFKGLWNTKVEHDSIRFETVFSELDIINDVLNKKGA